MASEAELKRIAYEIGEAAAELRHHCLFDAAAWISEQALSLDPTRQADVSAEFSRGRRAALKKCDVTQNFTAGRNYLSQRQYLRAAHCFEQTSPTRGTFMKYFARYQHEQHQKRGQTEEFGSRGGSLEGLRNEIERTFMSARVEDPFIYYLYGRLSTGQKAREALIQSVKGFPCNWSAWEALLEHVGSAEDLEAVERQLSEHWMVQFFHLEAYLKLKQYRKGFGVLKDMQPMFPQSAFFYASLAKCMFYTRQYDMALTCFSSLLRLDPHRTKDMDTYASLLYIQNKKVELTELAQRFSLTKKFTPEACCIIGQSYALKQKPKKAIQYFERAVRLDDSCLMARMYMAQEYIELGNHSTAIEMLQQVIDRDATISNAWHLMGKAYEQAEAFTLAEHAFTEACCLDPKVADLWLCRGIANFKLGKLKLAEFCFNQAEREGIPDGTTTIYLEKLKEKLYPDAVTGIAGNENRT